MIFSHSEYLGTISGVPEFQLILWYENTGIPLAHSCTMSNVDFCRIMAVHVNNYTLVID